MLALVDIRWWHYAAFVVAILFFLALDLRVFHRKSREVQFREALGWSALWFALAMVFAAGIASARGREEALQFVTGYIIELSLSMDNVFVIALIFAYFRVPADQQHRVLFWGIVGALVMRGVVIGMGAAAVARYHKVLYAMGVFLVYSGVKMLVSRDEGVHPEKNIVIRLARRFYPISPAFDGQRFITTVDGRRALTPLALVLMMVETTDLVFAVDSIPAIFAVTEKPFIIFTSNVFAILGLRSLYFVLAGAIGYFRFLKAGLSIVLVFIGLKMLLPLAHDKLDVLDQIEISTKLSLAVVAGIIVFSMVVSILAGWLTRVRGKGNAV